MTNRRSIKQKALFRLIILPLLLISMFLINGCQSVSDTDDNEVEEIHWSYAGETGPEHWASLDSSYEIMATGLRQSPINLTVTDISSAEPLVSINYQDSSVAVINNGHTIQVNVYDENYISIDGKEYELIQFHFHSPSEHTLNGEHFPLEAHFVHMSTDGELAVVGVLFDNLGVVNLEIEPIWDVMPETEEDPSVFLESTLNPEILFPLLKTAYSYTGSLTTPPGTEGVKWIVMKNTKSISSFHVDEFIAINGTNSRPTQDINEREINEITFQ